MAGAPSTLRELLADLGVTDDEVAAAVDDGSLMLLAVERFVFDDRPTLDIDQMLEATPFAAERTSELWRSLGFPDPPEGEPFFTDADLEIVSLLADLVEVGAVDPELLGRDGAGGGPVDGTVRGGGDRAHRRAIDGVDRRGRRAAGQGQSGEEGVLDSDSASDEPTETVRRAARATTPRPRSW